MTISLAAAPDGMRVGLIAGIGPDCQALITIAPKVWRAGISRERAFTSWPSGHVDLSLYETDRLHISSPSWAAEQMLASMLRRARDSAGGQPGSWSGALLAPDVAPPELNAQEWVGSDSAQFETANLLRLFQRVNFLFAPDQALSSRAASSPIYRPLSSRQFLDEVEHRLAQARRGYRRVQENRTTIRGRVSASSVARYQVTGVPRLSCSYEELTESTVLLGVICTALESIAEGMGARSILPKPKFDEASLRHDAVRLRRALGEVEALPVLSAIRIGHRLRLGRLDQPWARALRLALVLLSGREMLASTSSHHDFAASELSAETDRIWEWIVNAALTETTFDRVIEQGRGQSGLTEDPWKRHPISVTNRVSTSPDNIAFEGTSVFVVDAKYKTPPLAPSRGDQYQMFAYTHLVKSSGHEVRAAVLVYPGEGPTSEWVRGRDMTGDPVRLLAVQMPFPKPVDLISERAWASYLARCAQVLSRSLGLASDADDVVS